MKNFSTVFNFELKQFFAKTSTRVIMAIYFIIAIGITFIPSIANSNLFKGDSNDNFTRSAYVVKDVSVKLDDLKEAKKYDSKDALEKDIKDKKLDEGIVLTKDSYEYLSRQSIFSKGSSEFKEAFGKNVEKLVYKQNGLDYDKVTNVKSHLPQPVPVNVSGDSDAQTQVVNVVVVYALTFIVYMTVIQFGSVVATNVVKEKSNRAMELLVVTVNPRTLILGKVLALSVAVLIQMGLIIGGLFAGLKINGSRYSDNIKHILENVDLKVLGVGLAFALTVNGAITLPMLTFMGAFFVNYYIMGSTGDTKLAEILSYVPFTSYFVMFTRYAISNVSIQELGLSYGILVVTTLLVAFASDRVYRLAT